jgi:hydroxypyruvate isomerase
MNDVLNEVNNESNHNNLFMQYDIYHMAMMGENIVDTLKENMHRIGHIQFADMPGRGEPYTGELEWKALFACIEESDYDGWLGAEYRPSVVTENSLGWL